MKNFRNAEYSRQLSQGIQGSDKLFTDIFVFINGRSVPVNLSVLASASTLIRTIFARLDRYSMSDISLIFEGFSPDILFKTIDYIHGRNIILYEAEKVEFEECLDFFEVTLRNDVFNGESCTFCRQIVVDSKGMIAHLIDHESELKAKFVKALQSKVDNVDQVCGICSQALLRASVVDQKKWWRHHVKGCNERLKKARQSFLRRPPAATSSSSPGVSGDSVQNKCLKCHTVFKTQFGLNQHAERCRGNRLVSPFLIPIVSSSDSASQILCTPESGRASENSEPSINGLVGSSYRDISNANSDMRPRTVVRTSSTSALEKRSAESNPSRGRPVTSRSLSVVEIRCNECHESFSTREIMKLHTCNSFFDKQATDDGGQRKSKQNVNYRSNDCQDNDEDREASRELFPTKRRNSISEESGFGLERIILKIPKKQLNLPEQQQQQQHMPDAVKSPILVSNIEVSADCPTEVEKKDEDQQSEKNVIPDESNMDVEPELDAKSFQHNLDDLSSESDDDDDILFLPDGRNKENFDSDYHLPNNKVPNRQMDEAKPESPTTACVESLRCDEQTSRSATTSVCSSTGSVTSAGRAKPMPKSAALKRAKSLIAGTETADPPVTATKAPSTSETSPNPDYSTTAAEENIKTTSNFDVKSPENREENIAEPKPILPQIEEKVATPKSNLSMSKKPGPLSRKQKMADKNMANASTHLTCSNLDVSNEKSRTTAEINFTEKSFKECLSTEDSDDDDANPVLRRTNIVKEKMNSTTTKTSNSALSSTGVKKPVWKKPSQRLPSKKLIKNQLSKSSTEDEDLDRFSAKAGLKKSPSSRVSMKLIAKLVKTSSEEDSDEVYKPSPGLMSKKLAQNLLESSTEEEEAKINEANQPSASSGRSKQLSTKEPTTSSAKGIKKGNQNQIISQESDDDVHEFDPASRLSMKLTAELVKTSSEEDSDVVYKPSAGLMSKKLAKILLESSTEEEEEAAKVNKADQQSTSSGRTRQLYTKEIPPTFSAKGIEKENRNRIISDESDDDVHPPSQVSNAVKRKVPVNEEPKSVPTKKVRQDDNESEVEAKVENDELNTSTTDSSESSSDDVDKVVPLYTLDDDDCLVCDECQRKFDNAKLLELHLVNDHAPLF